MNPAIQAFVFDAYGTLFDPHSIRTLAEALFPGHGAALSQLWRTKQLEYSWVRTLMHRYEDFWSVTRDALTFSCHSLQLPCTEKQRDALLDAYLRLEAFPEVKHSLERLANRRLAILSNGSPRMLRAVVDSNGLTHAFERLLSVDELKLYKPHPAVYQQAADRLKVPKESIGFVSSNFWDVAGATSFGFQTFWLNRAELPADELGVTPTAALQTLADLLP
jgi:2-haloacid dehalogenase